LWLLFVYQLPNLHTCVSGFSGGSQDTFNKSFLSTPVSSSVGSSGFIAGPTSAHTFGGTGLFGSNAGTSSQGDKCPLPHTKSLANYNKVSGASWVAPSKVALAAVPQTQCPLLLVQRLQEAFINM
jgi:hypothetical protein